MSARPRSACRLPARPRQNSTWLLKTSPTTVEPGCRVSMSRASSAKQAIRRDTIPLLIGFAHAVSVPVKRGAEVRAN
ncbi:MAG: hypothetical protein IPK17_30435 [Chloroflexi bacterium]|uniref:hypothetical protein n=1 Tax=Candidatus Flexifilum breve TaxID=3140694 RepID=UPI003136527B|nr:hypothetical protein [Chloroflexota bacterium]